MLIANPLFAGTASGTAIHGSSLSASSHGSFGIADIGDSTTALGAGFECATMFMWAMYLTGFRMTPSHIHGYPGQYTSDVLAGMPHLYTYNTDDIASYPSFGWVHVSCGINDCTELAINPTPSFTIQDSMDNLTAIMQYNLDRGRGTIFSTLSHQDPGDRRPYMDDINDHIAALALANPTRVKVADYKSIVDNPGDPLHAAKAGYMSGPHYDEKLAAEICEPLLTIMAGISGSVVGRSRFRGDRPNLFPLGDFSGSAGSKTIAPGCTATGESSWDALIGTGLGFDSGDIGVVFSKESAAGEVNQWQVITVTGGTTESYIVLQSPSFTPPDYASGDIEIYISDASKVGGSYLPGPSFGYFCYDEFDAPIDLALGGGVRCGGAYAEPVSALMRTKRLAPVPTTATVRAVLTFFLPAAASVVIKLRNAGFEAVS